MILNKISILHEHTCVNLMTRCSVVATESNMLLGDSSNYGV